MTQEGKKEIKHQLGISTVRYEMFRHRNNRGLRLCLHSLTKLEPECSTKSNLAERTPKGATSCFYHRPEILEENGGKLNETATVFLRSLGDGK